MLVCQKKLFAIQQPIKNSRFDTENAFIRNAKRKDTRSLLDVGLLESNNGSANSS